MALTGERQMMVEVPNLNLSMQDDGLFANVGGWGDWKYTKYLGYHFITQTIKISLDAFFNEKLSLQLEGVACQKGYNPVLLYTDAGGTTATPKGRVNLQYYVSTTPPWVDEGGYTAWRTNEATGHTNTFSDSNQYIYGLNYAQSMIGNNTTFTANSNAGLSSRGWLSVMNSQMYGSNNDISGKTLYVTFMWVIEDETTAGIPPYPVGVGYFPPMRLVLGGTVYKPKKGGWIKSLLRNTKIMPKLP